MLGDSVRRPWDITGLRMWGQQAVTGKEQLRSPHSRGDLFPLGKGLGPVKYLIYFFCVTFTTVSKTFTILMQMYLRFGTFAGREPSGRSTGPRASCWRPGLWGSGACAGWKPSGSFNPGLLRNGNR